MATTNTVGAYDAKTRFSELLQRVQEGEEITITLRGAPVARIIPIRPGSSSQRRKAAIDSMRQLAARNRLEGLKIKDLISAGRK